jgi:hypothetical protein
MGTSARPIRLMRGNRVPIRSQTMPVKKKRVKKTPPTSVALIVRRGALRRFDKLKRATETLPVAVLWDRRTADGSNAPRGAQGEPLERRQQPAFTWDAADFVVVENHDGESTGTASGASPKISS